MKLLLAAGREIVGLFLDDEFLAVAALLVIAAAAILVKIFVAPPLVAGLVLLGGAVGALLATVWRARHSG